MNPEKIKSKSYFMIKAKDEWTTVLGGPTDEWTTVLGGPTFDWLNVGYLRSKRIVDKIKKILMIIEQKNSLDQGYIWVPYILTTNTIVSEYSSKNVIRRRKINKIFNLGLDIKDEFSPSKSISSRYSAVKISNPYKTIYLKGSI